MTRTDGEHELVLGNKQLLSAFFVVAILLGVFFTMGYFVGKNTATAGFNAGTAASSSGEARPDAAGKPVDAGGAPAATPAPDSTTPASDPNARPAPVDSTPAPPPPVEAKVETPVTAPPAREPAPEATPERTGETMATPSSEQMYLQIFALRRTDAEHEVKVLREHHFSALLGESSKPGIYRVLVGPFKTTTEMAHVKSDLKSKGFDSIVAK